MGNKIVFNFINRDEEFLDEYDYNEFLRITKDDENIFEVYDGEPEDSNLSRNFNDCFNISTLMELCYKLGKDGTEVDFTFDTAED